MKILAAIVIPPHLKTSGAINAAMALSAAVAERCDVDVAIMSNDPGEGSVGKARVLRRATTNILGFTRAFLPDKVRTLLYRSDIPRMIWEGDYDLVHIHNPVPALEMKRIAAACVKRGVPYVVSTHGFVEVTSGGEAYSLNTFYEKAAWRQLIENPLAYVVDHATMIFALSPLERTMLHGLGVSDERIAVVTNGVNPDYYRVFETELIEKTATAHGLDPLSENKRPTLAFLGNHTANKGVGILLEAFCRLDVPCQLVICGKKRATIDYESYVKRCGDHLNLVVTDFISDESVQALFQYSDVFVYPTLSDTLPLVILEAMASRLAIISTNVGGIPHQVTKECGLLVPPSDVGALTTACRELVTAPARVVAMGRAGEVRVRAMFDWNVAAEVALENYSRILDRGRFKTDGEGRRVSMESASVLNL